MPDLIGEATAIALIAKRAGLPRDHAADVLQEAVDDGRIANQNPPPRIDLSDATYPCSPSAWDHLYPAKYNVADVDALIASLTDSATASQPARPVGRPSKQDKVAAAYREIYPDGHERAGDSWKEVLRALDDAGVPVSESTIRNAIKARRQ